MRAHLQSAIAFKTKNPRREAKGSYQGASTSPLFTPVVQESGRIKIYSLSESWEKCLWFGAETRTISGNSSHFRVG